MREDAGFFSFMGTEFLFGLPVKDRPRPAVFVSGMASFIGEDDLPNGGRNMLKRKIHARSNSSGEEARV